MPPFHATAFSSSDVMGCAASANVVNSSSVNGGDAISPSETSNDLLFIATFFSHKA
jgi:hypothetical protein